MNTAASITDINAMNANFAWHEYAERSDLVTALADQITQNLAEAISVRGQGVLALSGGSTPVPLLKELSMRQIEWDKVVVTLVDERWVPVGHELSNAGMLLEHLLNKLESYPKFVPLFTIHAAALSADQSRISVLTDYCRQTGSTHAAPAALDVVVLGMGGDGHTASFFPDAENIENLIALENKDLLLTCHTPSSKVDRVTWSLPVLLNTGFLALHIEGDNKKQVFERALGEGTRAQLPIRSAIFQDRAELQVFYAD